MLNAVYGAGKKTKETRKRPLKATGRMPAVKQKLNEGPYYPRRQRKSREKESGEKIKSSEGREKPANGSLKEVG